MRLMLLSSQSFVTRTNWRLGLYRHSLPPEDSLTSNLMVFQKMVKTEFLEDDNEFTKDDNAAISVGCDTDGFYEFSIYIAF